MTRDLGDIPVRCDPVRFIVSLNDDDDTGDGRPDRLRPLDPQVEDNLRRVDFDHPGAAQVYIAEPVLTTTNEPALDTRVRAYTADRAAAFPFGMHPVPVSFYLEGIRTSTSRDDIGFEYQYFHADNTTLCGPGAVGTVVEVRTTFSVRAGGGRSFDRQRKMLVTAAGRAQAQISPADAWTTDWSYDGDATLTDPAALTSEFVAGETWTPVASIDRDLLRFQVREGGQVIEAMRPVNLTAPRHLEADSPGFDRISGFLQARSRGTIEIVRRTRIGYTVLDQARQPINESAWGRRQVQVRENILEPGVLTSPFADAQAWLQDPRNVEGTPNWRVAPNGRFGDRLWLYMPYSLFVTSAPGRLMWHPPLQAVGGVLVQVQSPPTHQWHMSVDGAVTAVGTRNQFRATVGSTRLHAGGIQIRVRSVYTVVTD